MSIPVVCFFPCCSDKRGYALDMSLPYEWPPAELGETWAKLQNGRRGMEWCIERTSHSVSALHLYTGNLYSVPGLVETAERLIRSGTLRLFIISAGYGVLDALEPARKYDAKMEGNVATYWRDAGLVDIIAEICVNLKPERVYGFFAGNSSWSGGGAKYRYFFTAGLKKAQQLGLPAKKAGCFHRTSGMGVGAILRALGQCFHDFAAGMFQESYLEQAMAGKLRYGEVQIGYEELGGISEAFQTDRPKACKPRVGPAVSAPTSFAPVQPAVCIPERTPWESKTERPKTASDFQAALDSIFRHAKGNFVDVKAGDLHRLVGGYPGPNHRMRFVARLCGGT